MSHAKGQTKWSQEPALDVWMDGHIMVSCQSAEVGSRLKTEGEKQNKSQEEKNAGKTFVSVKEGSCVLLV